MLNIIVRNVSLLIYVLFLYYFFSNWSTQITDKRKIHKIMGIVGVIIMIIGSFLSDLLLEDGYLPYINLIIASLLIFSVAKIRAISVLDAGIWTVLLLVTNLICEAVSFYCLMPFFQSNADIYTNPFFLIGIETFNLLLGLLVLILFKQIILKKQLTSIRRQSKTLFFLIVIPLFSIVLLFSLLMGIRSENNDNWTDMMTMTSIIILNGCVFFLYRSMLEHQHKQYQILLNKQSIESEYKLLNEMKKNLSNVNKLKHDLKNQYLVVLGLLANSEKKVAENYIKKSLSILEPPNNRYVSDNVLNYLLNEKIAFASTHKITVEHQLFLSQHLRLDKDVLTIIIGNILDNAIEASLRLPVEKRLISLTMKQRQNDLFIEVSNRFNQNELETRISRKDNGIGMKNINQLIIEMGGIYHHWHENNQYYVTIALFNVYQH